MTQVRDTSEAIKPYLTHLRALPFIVDARLPDPPARNDAHSKVLQLVTPQGELRAFVNWSRSHLTQPFIEHVVHWARQLEGPCFLFAPHVGRGVAQRLEDARINYVDLAGNCSIQLGDDYIAHIEGRRVPQKAPRQRALRAPALQVLFLLLATPELINAPLRAIAGAAGGVSPQTVSDLRKRLVAEEWVSEAGRRPVWAPGGKERALDWLLTDYGSLAHRLQVGRFRVRPGHLEDLEEALAEGLKEQLWSFGGGAALARRNGYYRGTRTIVYLEGPVPSLPHLLVPDERGEVIFSRFPGKPDRDEDQGISPLLIYLDLMAEGEPRASEAAAELRLTLFEEGDTHDS